VIVVDASAAIVGLMNAGPARETLASETLHVPHLIDSEIANALRKSVLRGQIDPIMGWRAVDSWRRLGLSRYAVFPLLDRVWQLRDSLSAYDATYVALAENLGYSLVTSDARLARASGIRCPVTVVPH